MNIRTRAKQNPPVASVNAALERDLITLQCEPVASTEFAFDIGRIKCLLRRNCRFVCRASYLPPIMADTDRGERWRIGAMHANIYRQQQELQKQAAKEFAAINNWRYTAKKSGAWYPRITTERMIFTTTSAHY